MVGIMRGCPRDAKLRDIQLSFDDVAWMALQARRSDKVLSSQGGIRLSPLVLGAVNIGDAWNQIMGTMIEEQCFKLLDAFVDAGGELVDTYVIEAMAVYPWNIWLNQRRANNFQNEQSEIWRGK